MALSPNGSVLRLRHLLLVLLVVAIWGTNFVVIHAGLTEFPPLLFAALRFLFCALPAIILIRRPPVPLASLAAYGLLIGAGQFGLLYIAVNGPIAPGLASLVIQMQVPFTILLSAILLNEPLHRRQALTFVLCGLGLSAVAIGNEGTATILGLALVLASAASWACANVLVKRVGRIRTVDFIVWASAFAVPPLLALSLIIDGEAQIIGALRSATAIGWGAVAWQSFGNTLFGFAAWSWLLARYPASSVTPAAILVPVFGLGSAWLILNEPVPAMTILGAGLIMGGVALEFWLARRRAEPSAVR